MQCLDSQQPRGEAHENHHERPYHGSALDTAGPPSVHRRVRRADHHGPRRGGANPALSGEAESEGVSENLVVQLGSPRAIREQVWVVAHPNARQASLFTNSSRLGRFPRVGLAEAHAHSSAVFVDELDTTGFQAAAHHFQRSTTRLMRAGLELAHSHDDRPRRRALPAGEDAGVSNCPTRHRFAGFERRAFPYPPN
jgi:hypothetical protein